MKRTIARRVLVFLIAVASLVVFSCGQGYFKTPEKTLEFYMQNAKAGNIAEVDAVIRCFTKADQDWWNSHYQTICDRLYGTDCPASTVQAQSTVWNDRFKSHGPSTSTADSVNINKDDGTAVVTVGGQDFNMKLENHEWKFDGFFGADAQLQEELKLD
jgi:hypothetical protein